MAFTTTTIALLSLLGAIAPSLAAGKYQAKDLATQPTLLLFGGLFLAQYTLLTFYRVIIYPHFVSPLRHLPGPKASQTPPQNLQHANTTRTTGLSSAN